MCPAAVIFMLVLSSGSSRELVAQQVEQRPFKAWVLGSNPSELTTPINNLQCSSKLTR